MLKNIFSVVPFIILSAAVTSCSGTRPQTKAVAATTAPATIAPEPAKIEQVPVVYEKLTPKRYAVQTQKPKYPTIRRNNHLANSFNNKLSNAALSRLRSQVRYDGSYLKIAYPGGDVPANIGVCTDVVIRSYRKLGIDLQEQVHRDMTAAFESYPNPKKWGLSRPDANIDHRRVYNLRKFFERRGAALPITRNPRNYKAGDIVSWMVGPDLPHIGVVVNRRSKADPNRLMIVHNIARGPQMEDILFAFPITGHYRYTPKHMGNIPTGIYTKRSRSKRRGMNYDQLVQAANLLGTNVGGVVQASNKPAPRSTQRPQVSNQELLDQVVRELSDGKPVGFKLCIGHKTEFIAICKAMQKSGITPDFITVDGSEGGTGAAPIELMNSVGTPMRDGLNFVHNSLIGFGVRGDIRIIVAGKVISAFHMMRVLALGADTINSARGMMFALGCIQSRHCNTDKCPTGIATQDPARYKNLDIDIKGGRVATYHQRMIHYLVDLLAVSGLTHTDQVLPRHINRRISENEIATYAEIYPTLEEGCLLKKSTVPEKWRMDWTMADGESWDPILPNYKKKRTTKAKKVAVSSS